MALAATRCLDSLCSCSSVRFSSCWIAARAPTCCILTCLCLATGSGVCQTPRSPGTGGIESEPRGYEQRVAVIGVVVGVCLLLLVLGFLLPRLSFGPQHGVDRGLDAGRRAGSEAPGVIGRLLSRSFGGSRRAADRSASTGRRARGKLPL